MSPYAMEVWFCSEGNPELWHRVLGCSPHQSCSQQEVGGCQCHPEPLSSGRIEPWFGSDVLLWRVPRGLLSVLLQEQLLRHVSPCWGLIFFALDTWSD